MCHACSFDVADLHIPWLCQQPFIFYSFCHLWPRQLLWQWRLSKQTLSHDMQHAAAWTTCALTADALSRTRIKLAGSIPKNSPASDCFNSQSKCCNSIDPPVGLLSAVAGRKDKLSSHHCCCSHPASCRKLQTERAAPTSVNNSVCISLTGVPAKTNWGIVPQLLAYV